MIIALTECYDVCDQPDQWPASAVLYHGALNIQSNNSAPDKSPHEDFQFALDANLQPGGYVLSVAHSFVSESAVRDFVCIDFP